MSQTAFKPVFDGFMKRFICMTMTPDRLADRAGFTGQWVKSRRNGL